jgi:hypothetical protein
MESPTLGGEKADSDSRVFKPPVHCTFVLHVYVGHGGPIFLQSESDKNKRSTKGVKALLGPYVVIAHNFGTNSVTKKT